MGDGWRWIACLSLCLSLPPSLIISLSLSLTFLHMAFPFPFTACTARQTFANIPSSDHSRCCCSHSRLWPVPQCRRYSLSKSPNRSFDFGSCISTFDTRESMCTRAYVQEQMYKSISRICTRANVQEQMYKSICTRKGREEKVHIRESITKRGTHERRSVYTTRTYNTSPSMYQHTHVSFLFPIPSSLVSRLSSLVSRLSSLFYSRTYPQRPIEPYAEGGWRSPRALHQHTREGGAVVGLELQRLHQLRQEPGTRKVVLITLFIGASLRLFIGPGS